MKVAERIAYIKRLTPKQSRLTGQLVASGAAFGGSYKRVTLWAVLVSSDDSHMVHPTIFNKERAKSAREWYIWFRKHVAQVYANGVLPGVNIRTDKIWSIEKWIGWQGGSAKSITRNSKLANGGNRAKRQGRKKRKNHIRR